MFTTFGSVVVEFELLLPVVEPLLSEGICKYGNTSVNIWEATGPAIWPPWWLSPSGAYNVTRATTSGLSTGEIAIYDATYPSSSAPGDGSDVPVFPATE